MMRQPPCLEQVAVFEARQQPLAGGDRRAQLALQLHHRLGVLERDRFLEPARSMRVQRLVEHDRRARRQEFAALDVDLDVGPAPSRAAPISAAALRISAASFARRPSCENGRHLNAGEAAPDGLARAFEGVFRRLRALQPVARVAAQPGAERRRRAGARHGNAEALALEIPQRDVERRERRLESPRRRASATRGRADASAAPARTGPARSGAVRIRGSPLDRFDGAMQRRFAPAAQGPRRCRCARTASCTSPPST